MKSTTTGREEPAVSHGRIRVVGPLSQADVVKLLGVRQPTVAKIESIAVSKIRRIIGSNFPELLQGVSLDDFDLSDFISDGNRRYREQLREEYDRKTATKSDPAKLRDAA